MANKKYPLWPEPTDYELPYQAEFFKRWLVNSQGVTVNTAKSYVSSIRTAFTTLFAENDATFKNLKNAFFSRNINNPERRIARLEEEYERLEAYIWAIEECGDVVLDVVHSNDLLIEKMSPKKMWLTAFYAYSRYIRYCIDWERQYFGMEITINDNPHLFLEVPWSNAFRSYLAKLGKGYSTASIDTYSSKLRRLYNLLFRRILKKDIFDSLERYIHHETQIWEFLNKLIQRIDKEIGNPSFNDLSIDDLTRGKQAFILYIDFLKDFVKHKDHYDVEFYEIPIPDGKE